MTMSDLLWIACRCMLQGHSTRHASGSGCVAMNEHAQTTPFSRHQADVGRFKERMGFYVMNSAVSGGVTSRAPGGRMEGSTVPVER